MQLFLKPFLKNKDYSKMMNILFREKDEIYINEFNYPNACKFDDLQQASCFDLKKYNGQTLTPDKLNIICGSFYMLKELLSKF